MAPIEYGNMVRKAIVLAGGNDQTALIKALRNRFPKIYIYLVDYARNPVAKPYADEHLCISTMDTEAVLCAAKKYNVDLVIIACGDQPLPIMAYVSEQLNLPCYLNYEQALNLTNKIKMKEIMKAIGIPTAKFMSYSSCNNVNTSDLHYPLIVKPADCNGSKGVRKIEKEEDLLPFLKEAMALSRTHTAIVEEYKTGIEISVDAYVVDGKAEVLMTSQLNKFKVDDNISVIYQSIIPASISGEVLMQIKVIAQQIASGFKLENSPLLIQLIVENQVINVIEFSARIGGGAKYQTIQSVTGFDILNANIDAMLGLRTNLSIKKTRNYYSRCHLYTKGGYLKQVKGVDNLLENGVIESVTYNKAYGTLLSSPHGSSDRVASFFVKSDSLSELYKKINEAINGISVINADNQDILMREMYNSGIQ